MDLSKSPGPNGLHCVMIDHLGLHGIGRLQDLFNLSWSLDRLQREWTKTIIIPIFKPGKDTSSPESFRPIAALFVNSWTCPC
ncbi:putative RNA-directed DNA polymerase from transposon BS [Trichonephila clavata]|uniref:Putative RNA-directed DNA polymerase from transposon BS n=1 Tax=Trichonephila clavata TaxID=2740835 RepID=A0A8X6GCY4_TRICU|nr:putative RNA-directed DNA polymerase from transposon BS [Trichonephila clavata]